MSEIISVGGKSYTAAKMSTGIDTISFTLSNVTEAEAKTAFKAARSISVGDDGEIYGEYPDIEFESIIIGADGNITVTMHILTKMEKQIKDLQEAVAELKATLNITKTK